MIVTTPATPTTETAGFLTNLFASCDTGWVTLFAAHPDTGARNTRWAPAADAAQLAVDAQQLAGWNVWVGPAIRRERLDGGRRGGKDDCTHIPALWVDIDIAGPGHNTDNLPNEDQAYQLVDRLPLPPTVIINSGHGLQAWWALQEPHPLENSDLLARWGTTWNRYAQEANHHLDNVFDAPRVMRLPGTTNTKPGCPPVAVHIVVDDWRNRYGEDDIDQWLDPAPAAPVNHHGIPYIGPGRPGDAYNARHTCAEQLAKLGFQLGRVERDGTQHWKWPNAAGDQSATTYPDGHAAIWSETAATQLHIRTQHGYDPYGLYTDTQHGGDHAAAARHLAALGYGTPPATLAAVIGTQPDEPSTSTRWLPDHFWEARPYLTHIRQAAWARTTSPDAVLAATLARAAAQTHHTYAIPPIVGGPGSLNYYAAIIAPSGAGKSTAIAIADELIPRRILDDLADGIPLGSGEGLAEAFMGEKQDIDPDTGKPKKTREQTRHNAYIIIDEGAAITAMMDRSGTTILETLRRGWTGQTLGQANASSDRRRIIKNYRLGLIVAFQPELAGRLLADHHAGTPQRFTYFSGTNPNIPDHTPNWPGPLHIPTPTGANKNGHLNVDPQIATQLRNDHRDKARGTRTVAELDSHQPMHLLKTAALLAILDARLNITAEDWALADTIWQTSCNVRDWLATTAAQAAQAADTAKAIRRAHSSIIEDETRATHNERRAQQLARNIARHIHEKAIPDGPWENGANPRDVRHSIASRDRHLADDAIQIALNDNLIIDDQGRYKPGPNRPA